LIFETIVTTCNESGEAHIAPMGIRRSKDRVVVSPFKPSTTLDNILATGCAVVNYTDDVRIFAGCLTGRRNWPLAPADKVACMRLEHALAHVELKLAGIEGDEARPRLACHIMSEQNHAPFRGFNRAQAAVLEAAILVSRLPMLPREKIEAEIKYLSIAIEKTAGPNENEAWGWLMEAVAHHCGKSKQGNPA
jgi:hypothetical protein